MLITAFAVLKSSKQFSIPNFEKSHGKVLASFNLNYHQLVDRDEPKGWNHDEKSYWLSLLGILKVNILSAILEYGFCF